MAIAQEDMLHGAAVLQILESLEDLDQDRLCFKFQSNLSRSGYLIEVIDSKESRNLKLGLYIKTSRSRLSPWKYTFTRSHQEEVLELWNQCDNVFMIFVAGDDGIALVSYEKLKIILDDHFDETEWVSISRKLNENYRVSGKDGKMESPLPRNAFPNQFAEYVLNSIDSAETQVTESTNARGFFSSLRALFERR